MTQSRTNSALAQAAGELSQTPSLSSLGLTWRAAEFMLLYAGIPVLFVNRVLPVKGLIAFLVLTGLVLGLWLRFDKTFDNKRFVHAKGVAGHWGWMLSVFLLGAAALVGLTFLVSPERLFRFPFQSPAFYAVIMVAYPIFSVYPQEIIFRTFLFHRYRALFRHRAVMIAASALAFGWGHVFFDANLWVTVGLSTIGGGLFAWTYFKTKSTLACAIEHALYGDFLFTVGLGWYFYTGSVQGG